MADSDILDLSDEDFLAKMGDGPGTPETATEVAVVPAVVETTTTETPAATTVETPAATTTTTTPVATETPVPAGGAETAVAVTTTEALASTEAAPAATTTTAAATTTPVVPAATTTTTPVVPVVAPKPGETPAAAAATTPATTTPVAAAAPALDYKALYEGLMAPLAANGKTIDLRSAEEVRQLMQMGANYTKKMQGIAPHRKVLAMLESNGMLDEGQLSYAIDLIKKDPAAIHKLIKDAGINPLEMDIEQAPRYVEGAHRVSDSQANFQAALTDMKSTESGLGTLREIDTNWDNASKEFLLQEPQALTLIQQQRENGIYDRIASEVQRQKTLGTMAAEVPFLQAYKTVGDQMMKAQGMIVPAVATPATPAAAVPLVPVATRVDAPRSPVANSAAAAAASPTRATPAAAKAAFNPLTMSDEDFMKLPNLRAR